MASLPIIPEFQINLKPTKTHNALSLLSFNDLENRWNSFMKHTYEKEQKKVLPLLNISEKHKLPILFDKHLNLSSIEEILQFQIVNFKLNNNNYLGFSYEIVSKTRLGNILYSFSDKYGIDFMEEYDYQLNRFTKEITIFPMEAEIYFRNIIKDYSKIILSTILPQEYKLAELLT